jgi:alpha-1,6-mannosyltransferase
VGYTLHSVVRWFGPRVDFVPWTRGAALVVMGLVLLAILWRSRNRNPLYGATLALLALIFLAPIAQPWYLTWPLALVAATMFRVRWLAIAIVVSMFTILPDGDGALKPLTTPLAYAMTALVVVVAVAFVRWLRGAEPIEDPMPDSGTPGPMLQPAKLPPASEVVAS